MKQLVLPDLSSSINKAPRTEHSRKKDLDKLKDLQKEIEFLSKLNHEKM